MRFDQPVGTLADRNTPKAWAGGWFDATGFGRNTDPAYPGDQFHEGADLNRASGADVKAPVYASADGVVARVAAVASWPGTMVVIRHEAAGVWTRYAHLGAVIVSPGQTVKRGQQIGAVGDYPPTGADADHVHFAVALISQVDLAAFPGDWPGTDIARLLRCYVDPLTWINTHREDAAPALWASNSAAGTRVRLTPDTSGAANIVGVLPKGRPVKGLETADGRFVKVAVDVSGAAVGGVPLLPSVYSTFDAYAAREFMEPAAAEPPPPPPPPVGSTVIGTHPALPALPVHRRVGIHLLNAGFPDMTPYHAAKCPSYTAMDNVSAARECRATGAAVIYRKFLDSGIVPDPEQFVLSMGLGRGDNLMVMGVNENDSIPGEDIRRRFAWDKAFAEAVWKHLPNCFPVIGSTSMGVPALEKPEVAAVWRETYGAFLNANAHRVGLNYHCYSGRPAVSYPPATATVIAPRWFEMRFLLYAYSPTGGGLSKAVVLVGDESGVDVGGHGGFLGCGFTPDQVRTFLADRLGLFEDYPQMYVHNLFMGFDGNKRWAGYNVRGYLSVLEECWTGKIAPAQRLEENTVAGVKLSRFVPLLGVGPEGESPLPADWAPARKDFGPEVGRG